MSIKKQLELLKTNLNSHTIRIIAVTKYSTPEQMVEAFEAGLRDFGESKLQQITEKWQELPEKIKSEANWHFIGHLQTNKTKKVVGQFCLIHSVDSYKLAEIISKEAQKLNITQQILLQVNVSQEESKHGFNKENLVEQFEGILTLSNIKVTGLMTMAPFTQDEKITRECFKGLRELRNQLEKQYQVNLPELSMGMSNDYKIAIEEGSTMIRIGQKLFS
ncbi:MAG: YggS family pyridoxal phosphate-dependent enzyme [Cyanobacteriota bacterium]